MINYENDKVTDITIKTDFEKIGVQHLDKMGAIPVLEFKYKGKILKRNEFSEGQCRETNGDCFEFINKHLNITYH